MTDHAETLRFEDFELDADKAELRRAGAPVALEPQTFDLIACLVRNAGRIVSRDDLIEQVWDGRIVSDAAISTRINAARAALGDDGKQQRLIRTVTRRGFRFVGELADAPAQQTPAHNLKFSGVRYLTSFDGTHLAYEISGEGPPLLKTPSFLTHLEMDHSSPVARHWISEASRDHRFIRFDQRGCGLSDRDVGTFTLDAYVEDIRCVMDHVGVDRAVLMGLSQGCPEAVAFAHRYPERVAGLVLHGGYVAGWRVFGDPDLMARREAMLQLVRVGWGGENPAFRQTYTSMFVPGGTREQHDWFNEMQRASASAENAYSIFDSFGDIDVRPLLAEVAAPTLVTHSRGDMIITMEAGRQFARDMPNARFVALDSDNHVLLEAEPAWPVFQREVRAFLAEIGW